MSKKSATTTSDEPAPTVTETIPPEELLTEQEQDVYSGGGTGVGPASASADSVPVETVEDLGIGPRDPYPSADTPPPPPEEEGGITRKGKTG